MRGYECPKGNLSWKVSSLENSEAANKMNLSIENTINFDCWLGEY